MGVLQRHLSNFTVSVLSFRLSVKLNIPQILLLHLRKRQGHLLSIGLISLLGAYPAYCAPAADSLINEAAEAQPDITDLTLSQPALPDLAKHSSAKPAGFIAGFSQVQTDLKQTVTSVSHPTTKVVFGSVRYSRRAADLGLHPKSPQVSLVPDRFEALEPVDSQGSLLERDGDRGAESVKKMPSTQWSADPDLGNLRLQESSDRPIFPGSPSDPNIPFAPPVPSGCDPELGCIRLQSPVVTAVPAPVMYLLPRLDIFRSNNILSGLNPIEDGLIRPAISLLVLPALGSNTYLNVSAEGALNQYLKLTQFNYSEIKFKAGIFQRLSPSMSAEMGWTNQQFFISSNQIFGLSAGTRFLNDHSVRFELSRRDQLAKNLSLNSFYQFRISFAEPRDRSRINNALSLSLNYSLNPRIQLGLDYQFASANFTVLPRTDLYHQVLGRISYSAFRTAQISLYGGISTGSSTESAINFNSFLLGVSVSFNWVIF